MVRLHFTSAMDLLYTDFQLGVLQPWGEVSHKKDKKPSTNHTSKPPNQGRGDSRGTRGGRGGRGGARGRGGHPKASGNGHVPQAATSSTWGGFSNDTSEDSKSDRVDPIAKSSTESHDQQSRISPSTSGRSFRLSIRKTAHHF